MASQVCWRASNYPSLLIEEWEDGFTVFQPDSGKTYFLNAMAMGVLEMLHSTPGGALAGDVIVKDLVSRLESKSGPMFVAEVDATLGQLDDLGLIEPSSPDQPRDS